MMKVAVIGSGIYAKSISNILANNNLEVSMWTEQEDTSKIIAPEHVNVSHSLEEVLKEAELVYILTGAQFVPGLLNEIKNHIEKEVIVVLGSKGILKDGTFLSDLTKKELPQNPVVVLSGPTFAIDLAHMDPCGFTIALEEKEHFEKIASSLKPMHSEYSNEIRAIELAGSLKNVYAIGSGLLSGLNYGSSTSALYMTKAYNEINSIYAQYNLDERAITTLACFGDLVLTCTSLNSRNYTFGSLLSLKNKDEKEEYLKNNTVEGYENLKAYSRLFKKENVKAPLLFLLHDIINVKKEPEALVDLLLKDE